MYIEAKIAWKGFSEFFREHTMRTINSEEEKKMKLLAKEEQKSWKCKNLFYLLEKIENKYLKDKKYRKVRYHCHYTGKYRGAAHVICNLKYRVP